MNSDSDDSDWDGSEDSTDDYDSMEEILSTDDDEQYIDIENLVNKAPDGTQWTLDAPGQGQPPRRNIRNTTTHPPGPKTIAAQNANDPFTAWKLFLSEDILRDIWHHTLRKREVYRSAHPNHRTDDIEITIEDIFAYIGIRYKIGVDRNRKWTIAALWNKEYGDDLCKAAMSRDKFAFIHRMLRFDDITTRVARRENDRFCAVRDIHNIFSSNCSLHWTPEHHATVDEHIVGFRGGCPIKVYDKTKPDKYGIKLHLICDSKELYVLSIDPYVRGNQNPEGYFGGVMTFKRLVENSTLAPGTGICADRFFIDFSLVDWCYQRGYSVLGTVRSDKRCVPASMRPQHLRGNPERYSRTVYAENCSLSAYIPPHHATTNFKAVLCLSSEHLDARVDRQTGKPMSIMAYNDLKPGVDMLNWCSKEYSVKKTTRRWPMRIFDTMMDIAGYNAWVIMRHNKPHEYPSVRHGGRKMFIYSLAKILTHEAMRLRAERKVGLKEDQRKSLRHYGFIVQNERQPVAQNVRSICHICPSASKRKSKQVRYTEYDVRS